MPQDLETRLANAQEDEESTKERYAKTRAVLSEQAKRVQDLEAQLANAFADSPSHAETESRLEQHKVRSGTSVFNQRGSKQFRQQRCDKLGSSG